MSPAKTAKDPARAKSDLKTNPEGRARIDHSSDSLRRFLTFLAVGLAATALHGVIAWMLINTAGGAWANTIGFVAALGVTYVGNYRFTFRSEGEHQDKAVRFLVTSALTLALSQWVLWFLQSMGADEHTSVLLAVAAIPITRFGVLATQVFSEPASPKPLVPWLLDIGVWVIAVGVGIIALLAVVPEGFLNASSEVWRLPSGDRGAGVVGMRYYLADDWHWPLLHTNDLSFPEGTNIIFTDSIPLMALGAKAARPLIGSDINYFPSWFIVIYSLQGVGGVALLRSLGVKRRDALVAGAILAVTFPAFVYRGIHPALDAHFIILLSLAAAFASGGIPVSKGADSPSEGSASRSSGIGSRTPGRWQVATGVSLVVSLLIHPYLLIMIAPLIAGVFIDHWRNGRLTFRQIALTADGTFIALFAVIYLGEYVGTHSGTAGYGVFGLNLLAPIYPQLSGIFPGEEPVLSAGNSVGWEAYNWLGVGAIGLLVAAVVLVLWRDRGLPRRSLGLMFSMLILTFMAVSQRITFGRDGVFNLGSLADKPLLVAAVIGATSLSLGAFWLTRRPSRTATMEMLAVAGLSYFGVAVIWLMGSRLLAPLSTVRASGRLWWPVGLLLVLGSVAVVARSSSKLILIPLAMAAAVQIVDTGPVRVEAASTMVDSVALPGFEVLRTAMGESTEVRVSPPFHCVNDLADSWALLDATSLAAERGVPINTVYTARVPLGSECVSETGELEAGELRVMAYPDRMDPGILLDERHRCRDNERLLVCTDQWAGLSASAAAPFLPLVADPVAFAQDGDAASVMTGGWGEAEEWGRDVPSSGATVSVPLIGVNPGEELIVRFRLRAVGEGSGLLVVRGSDSTELVIALSESKFANYEVRLPAGLDPTSGLEITLMSDPDGPLVGIKEMTVMLAGPVEMLVFQDD